MCLRVAPRGRAVFAIVLVLIVMGCHPAPLSTPSNHPSSTIPPTALIPREVERLAVLYPATADQTLRRSYARLEGAAFQLTEQRPALHIVDRQDFQVVLSEQMLQYTGDVSDDTAIRVGQLLGADTVLLYRIEGPTTRERIFGRYGDQLPPLVVTTKMIRVESGEVVFLNVVTAPIDGTGSESSYFSDEPALQAALERGMSQTITDLKHAFR